MLSDIYGVAKEIEAVTTEVALKRLLLHNNGKCKIAEHAKIQNTEMHMYHIADIRHHVLTASMAFYHAAKRYRILIPERLIIVSLTLIQGNR